MDPPALVLGSWMRPNHSFLQQCWGPQVRLHRSCPQVFHVAYVLVKFANSPRPDLWVLERSTDFGLTYQPWQYFACELGAPQSPRNCRSLSLQPVSTWPQGMHVRGIPRKAGWGGSCWCQCLLYVPRLCAGLPLRAWARSRTEGPCSVCSLKEGLFGALWAPDTGADRTGRRCGVQHRVLTDRASGEWRGGVGTLPGGGGTARMPGTDLHACRLSCRW